MTKWSLSKKTFASPAGDRFVPQEDTTQCISNICDNTATSLAAWSSHYILFTQINAQYLQDTSMTNQIFTRKSRQLCSLVHVSEKEL
jgi:hypothetical protein